MRLNWVAAADFEGYVHRCDTDFTYSVQQFDPATNITYCLMKEGQIIQEYSGTHMKACKCPRQWYEAKNNPRKLVSLEKSSFDAL